MGHDGVISSSSNSSSSSSSSSSSCNISSSSSSSSSNNNSDSYGQDNDEDAGNTEIEYTFDGTPILEMPGSWDHRQLNSRNPDSNPDPHCVGTRMKGKWHKFDGEYAGISWNCNSLFSADMEISRKKI